MSKMAAYIGKDMPSSDKPVLEPLLLPNTFEIEEGQEGSHAQLPCLVCGEMLPVTADILDGYLKHILEIHKLVIADVNLIANFRSYVLYWKERFKEQGLEELCSTIQTTETEADGRPYYLLSDVQPEDQQLREFLRKRKLENVLKQQQDEREDSSFSRGCLFCKEHFSGNRSLLFNHMAIDHSFNVGQPDNIVFAKDFLDILEEKLKSLQCLYCEKTFRDRTVLKEHMRKKQHRKINCKNKQYDRFYVINYLELGKNWEKIQNERDYVDLDSEETESEDEWSGWQEEVTGQAVCLFCDFSSSSPDKLQLHMLELHDFDLKDIKLRLNLNFYQQVKLVNYIRRQVHLGVCIGCQSKYESRTSLLDHMHETSHTNVIPDIPVWDQPQYFFPTYENDNLLCQIEDEDDNFETECVIAEDSPTVNTILSQETLRRELLTS